jgi:hypothetical protein
MITHVTWILLQFTIVHCNFLVRTLARINIPRLNRLRMQVSGVVRASTHVLVSAGLASIRTYLPRIKLCLVACIGLFLIILNQTIIHIIPRVQSIH